MKGGCQSGREAVALARRREAAVGGVHEQRAAAGVDGDVVHVEVAGREAAPRHVEAVVALVALAGGQRVVELPELPARAHPEPLGCGVEAHRPVEVALEDGEAALGLHPEEEQAVGLVGGEGEARAGVGEPGEEVARGLDLERRLFRQGWPSPASRRGEAIRARREWDAPAREGPEERRAVGGGGVGERRDLADEPRAEGAAQPARGSRRPAARSARAVAQHDAREREAAARERLEREQRVVDGAERAARHDEQRQRRARAARSAIVSRPRSARGGRRRPRRAGTRAARAAARAARADRPRSTLRPSACGGDARGGGQREALRADLLERVAATPAASRSAIASSGSRRARRRSRSAS